MRERNVEVESFELIKNVVELNLEAIEQDARLDAYYCLVTSERDKPPEEIVDIYRRLSRIEQGFRVTESDLEGHPYMFAKTPISERTFLSASSP